MGNLYNNINISDYTKEKRKQIRLLQDEFMTFSWGGVDAFESFGAFIINQSKGGLKFYNGPSFSNEYTKPQFDNAGGKLLGVSFNKQTIDFTIGVYWISIEHYRLLIDWLNPLKVADLSFGHSPKYRYNVKLSKIGDSTRWIVGHESIEGQSKPMYYTELNLTFEVQGDPCAKGVNSYEWKEHHIYDHDPSWIVTPTNNGSWQMYNALNQLTPVNTASVLWNPHYCDIRVFAGNNVEIRVSSCDFTEVPIWLLLDEKRESVIDYFISDKTNTGEKIWQIKVVSDGFLRLQKAYRLNTTYKISITTSSNWVCKANSTPTEKILTASLCTQHDFISSDLPTPFEVTIPLQIIGDDVSNAKQKYNLSLVLEAAEIPEFGQTNWNRCETLPLFNIDLKNLTHTSTSGVNPLVLNIVYNSQNGLVYLKYGTSNEKILTLLSLNDIGERIVDSFSSWKAKLPGEFDYPGFYTENDVRLKLIIKKYYSDPDLAVEEIPAKFYEKLQAEANIICFPRTNLA